LRTFFGRVERDNNINNKNLKIKNKGAKEKQIRNCQGRNPFYYRTLGVVVRGPSA
jgi:hypothetical protein